MRRNTFAVIAAMITAIGLSGNSVLRAEETGIVRVTRDFNERLDDRGRVRGDIVMGAMIGTSRGLSLPDTRNRRSADVEVATLPAPVVGSEPRLFCVRLNSKDGRFEAENTYRVTDDRIDPGGPFPYEGDHAGQIERMPAVALVALGRCGDRVEAVLPSAWAEALPAPDDRVLHVFVNSAGNPAFVEVGGQSVECRDVTDEDTLKYTASCVLSSGLLSKNRQNGRVAMTVYVSRSLGEDEVDVTVLWPEEDR